MSASTSVARKLIHARNRVREWREVAMTSTQWTVRLAAMQKVIYWQNRIADIYAELECEPTDPYAPGGYRDEPGYSEKYERSLI